MPDYPGKKFSFSAYDKLHLQNLVKQALKMDKIFKDAIQQGTKIGEATGFCDPDGEFLFEKFPAIKDRVDKFFTGLHDNLLLTITNGNREEWLLSAAKNNAMVDTFYKKAKKKYGEQAEEWTDRHMAALEQFNNRVQNGMNLSDRVWNLTKQFKQELELALELGLGDGKSAADLTKDVRRYLNEPNKLFRRVRDEKGVLRLSKAAQAYHPGRGVYRSSYKNALRLTATENNMAYRTSDYERWQDMDFVTGMQIKLSNNHTLNGKPFVDICDHLQGTYPKGFKFVGWHPFCRCIAVPRLADEDEFIARQQAHIDGESPADEPYGDEVTDLPDNFKSWVVENQEKIETARNTPYFIKDNQQAVNRILNPAMTPQEIADQRHAQRSQADIDDIKARWEQKLARDRKTMSDANRVLAVAKTYGEVDYSEIEKLIAEKNLNALPQATQDLLNATKEMRAQEKALSDLIPDVHEWHKQFTIAELEEVKKKVLETETKWLNKYGYASMDSAPLAHAKGKLEYEINELSTHQKYKTWEVAVSAYEKKLAVVNEAIEFEAFGAKLQDFQDFLKDSGTKSTNFKKWVKELDASIKAKDKLKIETLINNLDLKKAEIEKQDGKGLIKVPASTNKTKQKGHVKDESGDFVSQRTVSRDEQLEYIKKLTGVTDDKTAEDYYKAVYGFSYQWDWEIRQVQCGNTKFTSHHHHTLEEIKKRAQDVENFIAKSPQWAGGTTYRGMSLSDKELENIINQLKAGSADMKGAASWSTTQRVSDGFAGMHLYEKSPEFGDIKTNKVVLVSEKGHKKATSIKYLSNYVNEDEVLASMACRYEYIRQEEKSGIIYIFVKPK